MQILKASQVKNVDSTTVQKEQLKSVDLMERAALVVFNWFRLNFPKGNAGPIKIFCGLGNNGGDGLALARMLHLEGYNITIFLVKYSKNQSEDNRKNEKRLLEQGITLIKIDDKKNFPEIEKNNIVIDALLGSGLSKPLEGALGDIVHYINESNAVVISIDVPTGLFCDSTSKKNKFIVNADYTVTFQFPKLAFLFPENHHHIGNWEILPIGLDPEAIQNEQTKNHFIVKEDIQKFLHKRGKFSHKGIFGHALILAGSFGKMGAAVLSVRACMRSGVGLCSALVPNCGYEIMQISVPEAMVITTGEKFLIPGMVKEILASYNAIAIGPGIGNTEEVQKALKALIQQARIPLIFDADAINILSENKTWLSFIPAGCIFTPHPKEFERLTGKWGDDFEKQQMLIDFAVKHRAYIILKGAHSVIACPDGKCYFNSSGNAGMATAGSGDVLTGMVAGLLGQGYSQKEACILGVYIHGLAGDIAANERSEISLIASDIIEYLGKAFLHIEK